MARSRLNRPGWRLLLGLGVAAVLYWGAPPLLRRMDFFRVRQVEVRGLVSLEPQAVIEALKLPAAASLFDPTGGLARRVEAIPGLVSARVSRRIPGTLVVTVAEEPSVALVGLGGRLQLIGENGRTLPFDPTVAAEDLPILTSPDSLVTRLLARLRSTDATFFAQVSEAGRQGADVMLLADGKRYWFRPDATAEVFRAVRAVAGDLARRERSWEALDARFEGVVVVRWRAG